MLISWMFDSPSVRTQEKAFLLHVCLGFQSPDTMDGGSMNVTSLPSREKLQSDIEMFGRRLDSAKTERSFIVENLQQVEDDLELASRRSTAHDELISDKTRCANRLLECDTRILRHEQQIQDCKSKLDLLNATSLPGQNPAALPNQVGGEPAIPKLPPLVLAKQPATKNRGLEPMPVNNPQYDLFKFMARTLHEIDEKTKLSLCNLAHSPASTVDGFDLPLLMTQLEMPLPQVPLNPLIALLILLLSLTALSLLPSSFLLVVNRQNSQHAE